MLKGIDLSFAQQITPSLAGFDFVIVKASQADFMDPLWPTHSARVRLAGLPLCAYHYLKPASTAPIATQATRFLATARKADYLFLDQEGGATDAEAQRFLDTVRQYRECGLYHSTCGFGGTTGEDSQWVADYRQQATAAPMKCDLSGPFPGWDIWQYTSEGKVAGYIGDLDLDVMNPQSPLVKRLRIGYVDPAPLNATILKQTEMLAAGDQRALDLTSTLDEQTATISALNAEVADLQGKLSAAPAAERERIAEAEASRIKAL